jgi:stage III sporulation protein AG
MDLLRKWFKNGDKKNIANLAAALLLGIVLLVAGNTLFNPQPPAGAGGAAVPPAAPAAPVAPDEYAEKLEQRLADIFSQVAGAGEVRVLVTLAYGKEIVVAENQTENQSGTTDKDAAGSGREQYSKDTTRAKVLLDNSSPLIVKEIEPKVEGVVIVAKGGGDILVKDALTRAAQAVLGVEAHKVHVLKMK